jgi:hypothetical protein
MNREFFIEHFSALRANTLQKRYWCVCKSFLALHATKLGERAEFICYELFPFALIAPENTS